ncbi:MAG: hydroxypyruvate isomerase [Planctomycetota bacterium]|jgi:hydroxypyruvate isomerase
MSSIDRRAFLAGSLAAAASSTAGAQDRAVPDKVYEEPDRPENWVLKPGKTTNMRYAVNVEMWFRSLPFLDRIRASADLGFDAIEFWGLGGKDLEAIAMLCSDLRVEVAQFTAWGFNPGLNNSNNFNALVAAIEKATEAAAVLSARKATVVGGNDQPGMSQAEMHQNITDGLKLVAPIAEEKSLMLILEPMNTRVDHAGHCLYGSPAAVEICRAVNSPAVKINWDLYHMQISEGDLCGRLKDGFDQVGYLQVADTPGRNEPGTGEVNFARVMRAAKELGYEDIIGLECRPLNGEERAAQRIYQMDQWQ